MKAKVAKIRAVLEALNHMVQDGLHEGPSDYDNEGLTKQAKGLAEAKIKPGENYE
jgi:hypothetical protein